MDTLVINDRGAVMRQIHGKKWDEYRRLWSEAGKGKKLTDFPIHLDFDVVDACNYKCVMCNEGDRKRTGAVMSIALFKKIIAECSELGVYSINIGNIGESLLYPDNLIEFIKVAKNSGIIDIFVHTNGALLTKDVCEKLINSGLTMICFSIDAATPESYKKIRGGDYISVIENIDNFLRIRKSNMAKLPFVRVSIVPFEFNKNEISEFIEYWKTKADIIEIQGYVDVGFGKNISKNKKTNCLMPFQRMMIWPDGRIGACCLGKSLNPDLLIGKFPNICIKDAWNSEKMENLRKAMTKIDLKDVPSCKECLSSTYV